MDFMPDFLLNFIRD